MITTQFIKKQSCFSSLEIGLNKILEGGEKLEIGQIS